eukprot:gene19808-26490_t
MAVADSAPVEWVVGNEVVIRTVFEEEAKGIVFAFDKATDMVVLKETGAFNNVSNIRFIKAACVSQVLKNDKPKAPLDLHLPTVSMERCKKREERALQAAEVEASRVGFGVTKEAQAVFDALHKTMPCHWKGKSIVVLQEVLIDEPYTPESCHADAHGQALLERVKKVLAAERSRLGF